MEEQIQIFVTGGTFDKEYNFLTGELYFKDSHLPEMFDRGRCVVDIDVRTLMMVDSMEMTTEDREIIAHNCKKCPVENIIITHGTDTMVDTARHLAEKSIEPLSDNTFSHFGNDQVQGYGIWGLKIHALWWKGVD